MNNLMGVNFTGIKLSKVILSVKSQRFDFADGAFSDFSQGFNLAWGSRFFSFLLDFLILHRRP